MLTETRRLREELPQGAFQGEGVNSVRFVELSAAKSEKEPWTGLGNPGDFQEFRFSRWVGQGFLVGHQGGGDSRESPGQKQTVKGQETHFQAFPLRRGPKVMEHFHIGEITRFSLLF